LRVVAAFARVPRVRGVHCVHDVHDVHDARIACAGTRHSFPSRARRPRAIRRT
jgi:hypothetical protein